MNSAVLAVSEPRAGAAAPVPTLATAITPSWRRVRALTALPARYPGLRDEASPALWVHGRTADGQPVGFEAQGGDIVHLRGGVAATRRAVLETAVLERQPLGRWQVLGLDAERLSGEQRQLLQRRHIGRALLGDVLDPALTALGNVAVARRLVQPQAGDAFDLAALELDALGLSEVMHRRPSALAPDEQRLVLLARALVGRRRLVVVEQPEAGLSPLQVTAVRLSLWTAAALHGCCVLMSTDHARLAASANRSVPLHGGRGAGRWVAA
ncbi:hypothetical protein [Aquabacterium sp. OR-4]|uniref:hypothetical protein n=1 Tax=Aquabacterium sp. OR-4 TaxID=2978127 RepID=UPI0021B1B09C|nr:hypothetical protein [Aquabacterium sp. OR-4]MDT7833912.1 hypothetical protein [Aquabacterium sp. OR-4]